jgi:DNA polymerase III psi subunit
MAGLHPQSPRHFTLHDKLQRESHQILRSSYLSHIIAAATYADEYWNCHPSDYAHTHTQTLIYAHSPFLWRQPRLIHVAEAEDSVELILLQIILLSLSLSLSIHLNVSIPSHSSPAECRLPRFPLQYFVSLLPSTTTLKHVQSIQSSYTITSDFA